VLGLKKQRIVWYKIMDECKRGYPFKSQKGWAELKLLFIILLLAIICYMGIKLGRPFYVYKDLEKTMERSAIISLRSYDYDHSFIVSNIMDKVKKYNLPLEESDIVIYHDQFDNLLTIEADYYINIEFPKYTHRIHFKPRAVVKGER